MEPKKLITYLIVIMFIAGIISAILITGLGENHRADARYIRSLQVGDTLKFEMLKVRELEVKWADTYNVKYYLSGWNGRYITVNKKNNVVNSIWEK